MFIEVLFIFSKNDQNCDLLDIGCCFSEKNIYSTSKATKKNMPIFEDLMMQYLQGTEEL